MKVLDLQCECGHCFEGWFASEEAFRSQLAQAMVECPFCGQSAVSRKPSAPRLNLGHSQEPQRTEAANASPPMGHGVPAAADPKAAWMHAIRKVLENTEDVGERFAEEARRMHYGETRERGIRGQASLQDTAELLEEGIAVMPLTLPKALKGPLQ